MKKPWGVLAVSVLCGVVGSGIVATGIASAQSSGPSKISVGLLVPLTGPFAAMAETQKQGGLLAIDMVNKRGGLAMPWGRVQVEGIVQDDESKLDVGVRRYRYLASEGVKGVGGQAFAPLTYAINAIVAREPMPYFPLCVLAKEAFQKGKMASSTFAVGYNPWTVGYMAGSQAVKTLGKKRIFMLARSDSWGWDIRDGVSAAAKQLGAQVVGTDEASLGTSDFTTILQKVRASDPDVLISAQTGADQVALVKQAYQMGLGKEMALFSAFTFNVMAKGMPPEAMESFYALHYFYYDLSGLDDKPVAAAAAEFSRLFRAKYGVPPDAYAATAYIGFTEMLRGFEAAKSFDAEKVAAALMTNGGKFDTIKGPAVWRQDHQAAFKYAAFLVKGKVLAERKDDWDLFTVVKGVGGDEVLPSLKSLGY